MVHLHVITAVLVILALGLTGARPYDPTLIQWQEGCSQYAEPVWGRRPFVAEIYLRSSSSESSCRSLCTSRQDCGGFVMRVSGSTSRCRLYNINDDIISDHLSDNWWGTDITYTWHSKTCRPYSVGVSDMSCNEYKDKYEENRYISPSSVWWITGTWDWIPNLPGPRQCQAWCTLYPGCRSVGYERRISDGSGRCYLYMNTIEEMLPHHSRDVTQYNGSSLTYTTYDRYCPDTDLPYLPKTRSRRKIYIKWSQSRG